MYSYFLLDTIDRKALIRANNDLIRHSDELWVFGPISDGVKAEIELASELKLPICSFADKTVLQSDLVNYITKNSESTNKNTANFVAQKAERLCNNAIFDYENSNLENKYKDFGLLMKEYKDGILLFNISNQSGKVMVTSIINLTKVVYSSTEYHSLKELFSRIVDTHQSQIVFKKR